MKLLPRGLGASLMIVALPALQAIDRLPIEDFSRQPDTLQARLSPDGKTLAFLRDRYAATMLYVVDLDSGKMHYLDPGSFTGGLAVDKQKEIGGFIWVGNRRFVAATSVGLVASDIDALKVIGVAFGENGGFSSGQSRLYASEVIHTFYDAKASILMLDRHVTGGGSYGRPDILKVDTTTGFYSPVEKNPGEVAEWGLDEDGVARLGILSHGDQYGAIYRENAETPWRTILPLRNRKPGQLKPLGFDKANNRVFVSDLTKEKRWSVFPLNPADGSMGEALMTDPVYDILPQRFVPAVDRIAMAGPIFSPQKQTLVGLRFYNEAPRIKWFDKDYQKYQRSVDTALPNTVNVFVNQSLDGKRLLWFAFSDQDPGSYYLLDTVKPAFTKLVVRNGWIKPAQMATMRPFHYAARDGLVVHGYLTIPAGHEPRNLPLIVMPHGGPWVRDAWGYDPFVQLLANRGYAVLQMNYRGSPGYGDELFEKARKQIGGQIQDDIEDATRWAIAAGVADPKRIAIMGMSYGGYSTLFALGRSPGMYRCGISMAGVSDWYAMFSQSDVADYKMSTKYWKEQIGDPSKDEAFLKSISPVYFADKMEAPLLIIQGKEDVRVPPHQAKSMIAALEKAGRKPESLFMPDLNHNWGTELQRQKIYQAIVTFLEKNLGEGVK